MGFGGGRGDGVGVGVRTGRVAAGTPDTAGRGVVGDRQEAAGEVVSIVIESAAVDCAAGAAGAADAAADAVRVETADAAGPAGTPGRDGV